jgi:hypothetical protein
LIGLVCAAVASPATDLPPPSSAGSQPSQSGMSIELKDVDQACLEWTDTCRVCKRAANNQFSCSNIGIACQPSAGRCTRRN